MFIVLKIGLYIGFDNHFKFFEFDTLKFLDSYINYLALRFPSTRKI